MQSLETKMKSERIGIRNEKKQERGAALATVLLIAFLLITASIALLSGVAAGTRNGTDMLSETKAFYAAESGLQATINALRHRDPKVKYSQADANPSMDSYITYNYQAGTADQRVVIGQAPGDYVPATGEAYVISVQDPDNYGDGLTFNTYDVQTRFTSYTGTGGGVITGSGAVSTVTISATPAPTPEPTPTPDPTPEPTPTPDPTPTPQLIITMTARPVSGTGTSVVFNDGDTSNDIPALADFTISYVGGSGTIMPDGDEIKFQIVYTLTAPRTATKTIYGKITKAAGQPHPTVTLDSSTAEIVGSTITFCSDQTSGCSFTPLELTTPDPPTTRTLYGRVTPVEPVRLLVKSTGYGPNGAKKELEAIIRKDLPNLAVPPGLHTMIGGSSCPADYPTCLGFSFAAGTSNGVAYSGCDGAGNCVPSFLLTDPNNYQYVSTHPPSGNPAQMQPPPEMSTITNLPDWQQSPAALDAFVDEMRSLAQGSDRYFRSSNGTTAVAVPNNPGDFGTGTGITFCEGSCQVGGSGGGIMVVTGKLTNTGNFSFRGLIVVTGEDGWLRNGGGNGQIIGNVVIAPYNMRNYVPENLHLSSFLPPRYQITGGGGSDIIYGDITSAFSSTSGVSDIVQGVAEK